MVGPTKSSISQKPISGAERNGNGNHRDSNLPPADTLLEPIHNALIRFSRAHETSCHVAFGAYCTCRTVDCTWTPRSTPRVYCNFRDRRWRWCGRCTQYVVRRGYRCGNDPHRHASNSSWRRLALRSAYIRTDPCRKRCCRSWLRAQSQGGSAARLHDLLLRRRVHDMAEAAHAAEHCHRWCRRRAATVSGWTAATGDIGLEPFILFLIVFLWTPPHFWSLSLNRTEEYARAGVPMLPVVAGRTATTRQILIYSFVLMPVSMLPWALGFAGTIYGAAAAGDPHCPGVAIGQEQ
jgi:hypothetical protein